MKKIPIDSKHMGKMVCVSITRGFGDNARTIHHRGVVVDKTHTLLLIRSIYSDREMWIPRPRLGRDNIEEIEAKK